MSDFGTDRSNPRPWNHQFHVLRALKQAIESALSHLAPSAESQVVDLGCGDRPYEHLFRSRGCTYVPCDLDGPPDVLRMQAGKPLPFESASVQGVVSFQVLEHVWNLDEYLGEAHRILRPDGWLLLSTHGSWPYHPHPTDFRRWTRPGLIRELQLRGFEVERVESVVGLLALTTQYRLLGLRHLILQLPTPAKLLLPLASLVANIRMYVEDALTPAGVRDDNACVYVVVARKSSMRSTPSVTG